MRRPTNNIFIDTGSGLIHRVIWAIVRGYLGERGNKLGMGIELRSVFDHIVNIYETEGKEKGLMGVLELRKRVKDQIDELSVGTFLNKQTLSRGKKDFTLVNFEEAFTDLAIYKDIFSKIAGTVETLSALKRLLTFIVNILTIPIVAFNLWIIIRKVIYAFSLSATASLGLLYYSNFNDGGLGPGKAKQIEDDSYSGQISRAIKKAVNSTAEGIKSIFYPGDEVEAPKQEVPIEKIDIFTPQKTGLKGIPTGVYNDEEGINKYVLYTGVVFASLAIVSLILWKSSSDSDSAAAAAAGGGIGATLGSILPEGMQNYFNGGNWTGTGKRNNPSVPNLDNNDVDDEIELDDGVNSVGSPMIAATRPKAYEYDNQPGPSNHRYSLDDPNPFFRDKTDDDVSDTTVTPKNKKEPVVEIDLGEGGSAGDSSSNSSSSNPTPLGKLMNKYIDRENRLSSINPLEFEYGEAQDDLRDQLDALDKRGGTLTEEQRAELRKATGRFKIAQEGALQQGYLREDCLHPRVSAADLEGECRGCIKEARKRSSLHRRTPSNDTSTNVLAKGFSKLFGGK